MEIKQTLKEISTYYQITRQAGHTTLMEQGTANYPKDKLVLCLNMGHGNTMKLKRSEIVPLDSLERLRGHNTPLAIDNGVLIEIFDQTVLEYAKLEKSAKANRIRYLIASKKLREANLEINKMRNQPFRTFFKSIFGAWQP